jgi:2-polyprenyl-3-methyl-5-hydroxy-6-metoxy-1,4-benzoquinol methylase
MIATVERVKAAHPHPLKVLVFGCGYFHERHIYPPGTQFILVDQDSRLTQSMEEFAASNRGCFAYTSKSPKEFERVVLEHANTVNLITAKEVIEHITEMDQYFTLFKKLLAPQGTLWVSTPNYGDWTLPLVESTFLEAVARCRGFSRKEMHPNRYSKDSLSQALRIHGFENIDVQKTQFRFALTGSAINPG